MYTGSPPLQPWETEDWQWFNEHRQVVTEADWLTCPEPGTLLDYLNQRDDASPRKFFLAGAACVRRVWHLLDRPELRAVVEAAEQFADGVLTREQLSSFTTAAADIHRDLPREDLRLWASLAAFQLRHDPRGNHGKAEHTMTAIDDASRVIALATGAAESSDAWYAARFAEMRIQANLYRCVLGNPFRPVTFAPEWRTDTALALARQMYESREFGAMPILADALQDAGCNEPAILDHCRDASLTHVRGCWATDLVLGKS
jgi:hypothetical protein